MLVLKWFTLLFNLLNFLIQGEGSQKNQVKGSQTNKKIQDNSDNEKATLGLYLYKKKQYFRKKRLISNFMLNF